MASSKVTDLTLVSAPEPTDQIYLVRPVDGAAGSLTITNDDLFSIVTRNIASKLLTIENPPGSINPGTGTLALGGGQDFFYLKIGAQPATAIGDVVFNGDQLGIVKESNT